jgi:hypothetical protein
MGIEKTKTYVIIAIEVLAFTASGILNTGGN